MQLFDNGTNGLSIIATRWTSRGVILAINERDRTVRLHAEFNAPDALHWDASSSQGSVQVLDDGNVLVGFGKKPFFVVYTPDGHPLLTGEVGSGGESCELPTQKVCFAPCAVADKALWSGFKIAPLPQNGWAGPTPDRSSLCTENQQMRHRHS